MSVPAIVDHRIRGPVSVVEVQLNRSKAIKAFCSECLGWSVHPKDCTDKLCALYPWRGKYHGYVKREMTDEQRLECAERLRAAREKIG